MVDSTWRVGLQTLEEKVLAVRLSASEKPASHSFLDGIRGHGMVDGRLERGCSHPTPPIRGAGAEGQEPSFSRDQTRERKLVKCQQSSEGSVSCIRSDSGVIRAGRGIQRCLLSSVLNGRQSMI